MERRKARASSRHQLAAAIPYKRLGDTPLNCLYKPSKLDMWGNDVFGDCVTAEEAFAKACHKPEIFIPFEVVEIWAANHGTLNGANIADVLNMMQHRGFLYKETLYNDGAHNSVDWKDAPTLRNAIAQGPVKIGIAATELENIATPKKSGWFATKLKADPNLDHCVSLCGFGTIAWLATQFNVPVPEEIDGTQGAYALYTWNSIGIIDVPSLLAICGEAWLRTPTTVIKKLIKEGDAQ